MNEKYQELLKEIDSARHIDTLKIFVAELENTKKEDLEKLFQKYKEENEK